MSMMAQAIGALIKIGLAFVIGIVVSGLLILLLGTMRQAWAQEATPVYEAHPGQIDAGFNYRSPATVTVDVESVNDPLYDPGYAAAYQCDRINDKLLAMITMISLEIAKDPVNGHFYKGAIETIHSMWCTNG